MNSELLENAFNSVVGISTSVFSVLEGIGDTELLENIDFMALNLCMANEGNLVLVIVTTSCSGI